MLRLRTPLRAAARLWVALLWALSGSCGPPQSFVVVHFDAGGVSLAAVTALDLDLTLAGKQDEQRIDPHGELAFPTSLTLDLGASSGSLAVTAFAVRADGNAVARAMGSVEVQPGSRNDLWLVFEPTQAAQLALSPVTTDVGPTRFDRPAEVKVEVRNVGVQKSGALDLTVTGNTWTLQSHTCMQPLPGSATCTATLQLRPSAEEESIAQLVVRATPGGMAQATLRGTGTRLVSLQRIGGVGADSVNSVAIDDQGSLIASGFFSSTVNFGRGDVSSVGLYDAFVSKYDAQGGLVWSKQFGSVDREQAVAVAVDASRNVLVTGYFRNSVSFGGPALTSAGNADIYIAKYTADGTHLWSKRIGGVDDDVPLAMAVDASGNILVSGYFYLTVDFGAGNVTSAGDADVFLLKLAPDGSHLWSKRVGGVGNDVSRALAVRSNGDVAISGHFTGSVNLGGGPLTSLGGIDVFLAVYDSSGQHLWSRREGGTGSDSSYALAFDSAGNLVTCGGIGGAVSIDSRALPYAGGLDVFIAKYNTVGSHQWSRSFGSGLDDLAYALAVDASGQILMTGNFVGNVDFGGGPLLGKAGSSDAFIAKYDAAGAHLWSKSYGDTQLDAGFAIAIDRTGQAVLGGIFQQAVDFGRGPVTSAGDTDGFLLRLLY